MGTVTENNIEQFAIVAFKALGWKHVHGLVIAPGAESAERESFEQIILIDRLRRCIARLNPDSPPNPNPHSHATAGYAVAEVDER